MLNLNPKELLEQIDKDPSLSDKQKYELRRHILNPGFYGTTKNPVPMELEELKRISDKLKINLNK